jgi:hypothetical protein
VPVSPQNLVLTGSLSQLPYDALDKILQSLVRRLTNGAAFQLFPSEVTMEDLCQLVIEACVKALVQDGASIPWPDWVLGNDRSKASQIITDLCDKGKFNLLTILPGNPLARLEPDSWYCHGAACFEWSLLQPFIRGHRLHIIPMVCFVGITYQHLILLSCKSCLNPGLPCPAFLQACAARPRSDWRCTAPGGS